MRDVDEARALMREATRLEAAGRLPEAEETYRRLLTRWPAVADAWFNLAVVQRKSGRFDEALASYDEALRRGISQPEEVHLNRGVIYSDHLRRDAAALAELRRALQLNPGYVPALLNLANLHEDLGRRDDAVSTYERLLALDPACAPALARYASLQAVSGTPSGWLVDRLRGMLASPGLPPLDRSSLGFALGTVLDRLGEYDAAFGAFSDANRVARALAEQAGLVYDRRRQERFVADVIRAFPATPAATITHASSDGPLPLFVCGMFRSGSTLLEQVLAGHPRIAAGGEIDMLPRMVARELAPFPQSMSATTPTTLAGLAARYRDLLASRHPAAGLVVDKRPDNFLYLGLVDRLFPAARVVETTRDPLDNCLSIFFLHLDLRMTYALDLLDIGHYYRCYRRLMAHWREALDGRLLSFVYEDFVADPRAATGRVLEFAGVDWQDECLAFERRANAVKTASVWQVRQPLYRHAAGRARHYVRHLAGLAEELQRP